MRSTLRSFLTASLLFAACDAGHPTAAAGATGGGPVPGGGGPVGGGAQPTPTPAPTNPIVRDGQPITLRGRVTDTSNAPVRGARVRVRGETNFVPSDGDGRFTLYTEGLLPLIVTAGKDGFFNGNGSATSTQAPVALQLAPIPTSDDPNYQFLFGTDCAICHPNDHYEWSNSNMSMAGINLWTHDVHNGGGTAGGQNGFVYKRDSVLRTTNPTGECANCHQPMRAARNPNHTDMAPLSDPEAQDGVTCDVCHKTFSIGMANLGWPGVDPLKMRMRRPADAYSQPIMFGPRDDATFNNPPMAPAFSSAHEDGSRLCAGCHEDANDTNQNGRFDDPGDIPHEMSFSEWRASSFAVPGPGFKSCADCHMLNSNNRSRLCNFGGPIRPAASIHGHTFEGTTAAMVQSAANLTANVTALAGRRVRVDVDIHNHSAGHKFPTGVHIRNLILKVEVTQGGVPLTQTAGGSIDFVGGVGSPAQGDYAGLPGKTYARVYGDAQNVAGVFYTEGTTLQYDTRILPGQHDRPSFEFQAGAGAVDVRVVLLYRRAYRHFIRAKGWTTDGHGNPLADVIAPDFGVKVGESVQSIVVP